jgi:uncharacterized membrane protein (UPF0127 family)
MSRRYSFIHLPTRTKIGTVEKADTWWTLGVGVIGKQDLPPGEGLWLPGVASVHTCFVRFPLDLVFLDKELRVLKVIKSAPTWKFMLSCPGAYHTIELGDETLSSNSTLSLLDECTLTELN